MKEKNDSKKSHDIKNSIEGEAQQGDFKVPKKGSKSKTPILDTYGRDVTELAEKKILDPVVGRSKEVDRVSQIISRRKKNNPILIGDPGVGKTSIAEGLAQKIVNRKVSRLLFDKRIINIDLGSMVAGTKYRGQFEERLKSLINEIKDDDDIILFIDEIHTIIGAGGAGGSLDASNMLKPALARGEIQVIGATTQEEYRVHFEKDGALDRRFQKVEIEEASEEETLEILKNIKSRYEDHHNVYYNEEALKACVDLSVRYINDRFLPDKAIDAMDEAGARIHISNIRVPKEIVDIEQQIQDVERDKEKAIKTQEYEKAARLRDQSKKLQNKLKDLKDKWEEDAKINREKVDSEGVAEVISLISGVPVTQISLDENKKLNNMYDRLSENVIGQNEAVEKVVESIQRGRIGMQDPKKPIFSGILIGNSGVGKTELAKQVARYMFDSEDALIRLDMSEFSDSISMTKFQGAAPGYVGYDDSSFLDTVRRKPYSVILFDEIEKAHSNIFNIFLQMLDDGVVTDSHGRKTSFKNTIILMTSNVGTKQLKDFGSGIGFSAKFKEGYDQENRNSILQKELKRKFPPEFINRLDEIIYFNDLKRKEIESIADLELSKTEEKAEKVGYKLVISDDLKNKIIEDGYEPKHGARPLKRSIKVWVDNPVSSFIIKKSPKNGSTLNLGFDSDKQETVVSVKKRKYTKKEEKKEEN